MDQIKQYRHELKYRISYLDYRSIKKRLEKVMTIDPHTSDEGFYGVKSIYFDNLENKALKEKKSGIEKREKFRIRFYDDDLSYIILEKKIKSGKLGLKYRTPIKEEELRRLLDGDKSWMKDNPDDLVKELYAKMTYQQLKPRVLVSYKRESFVYRPGNVRVSFDSSIRSTMRISEFLNMDAKELSVTEGPQDIVLEVKYDAFMPDIIKDLLQIDFVRQQSFSKYGSSRRFG